MIKVIKFILKIFNKKFIFKLNNYINFIISDIKEIDDYNFDKIYLENIKKRTITILDVGAGHGESINRFTSLFSNKILKIHSFDPINESLDYIRNNISKKIQKNHFITLNNVACGEKNENIKFFENNSRNTSSFFPINKKSKYLFGNNQNLNYKTKVIRLKDYISKEHIKNIDILKIDTQGFESYVLMGLGKYLQTISYIEVEFLFENYFRNNKSGFFYVEEILNKKFKLISLKKIVRNSSNRILWIDALYENKNKRIY